MLNPYNLLVLLVFLTIVTLLVAAHEWGHYLFARLFKMDVEEFSIGFGKRPIWTWMRKGDTVFTVRPWPLGGFVKIRGMVPDEDGSETQVENGFYSKEPGKRFLVLLAGPLFSLLAGLAVLIPLYTLHGVDKPDNNPIVDYVGEGGRAAQAGIKSGDRVIAIDGQPIATFYAMSSYVRTRPEQELKFSIERAGKPLELMVRPSLDTELSPLLQPNLEFTEWKANQGKLGIQYGRKHVTLSFSEAIGEALSLPGKMVGGILNIFRQPATFKHQVGGPATMIAATKATMESGLPYVIQLAGLLSISLAIFNLFPVHPLDGGQMVVALAEMCRRGKRLSFKMQGAVSAVGFALVLMLIVGVLVVDFQRWVMPPSSKASKKVTSAPKPPATTETETP